MAANLRIWIADGLALLAAMGGNPGEDSRRVTVKTDHAIFQVNVEQGFGLANRVSRRRLKFNPAQRCKSAAHNVGEIVIEVRPAEQRRAENLSGFFLHGPSMLRRSDSKAGLGSLVQLANRECCHAVNAALTAIDSQIPML
jgi:hypothetical protein